MGSSFTVERADQQLDLARATQHEEPVGAAGYVHGGQAGDDRDDSSRSWHASTQPVDRLHRQPAAHVRRHLDDPAVRGVGERRAERVERADEFGFEYQNSEHHCHPERDADHAEQGPAPVGDQGCEVDTPERQPTGTQPSHHRSPVAAPAAQERPSTRCSCREP